MSDLDLKHIQGIQGKLEDIKARDARLDDALSMHDRAVQQTLGIAEYLGDDVSTEQVEEAVEEYFDQEFSFREPRGLTGLLAKSYVHRGTIAKAVGIPSLVLGLGYLTVSGINTIHQKSSEIRVEELASTVLKKEFALEDKIDFVREEIIGLDLPSDKRIVLSGKLSSAEEQLDVAGKLIEEYCVDSDCTTLITTGNYSVAEKTITNAKQSLTVASGFVSEVESLIDDHRDFLELKGDLSRTWDSAKLELDGHLHFLTIAEQGYNLGEVAIRDGDKEGLTKALGKINFAVKEQGRFEYLSTQVPLLCNSVGSVAKGSAAKVKVREYCGPVDGYLSHFDSDSLTSARDSLNDLNDVLRESYDIRIVTRRGEKSGNRRFYALDGKKKSHQHYLLVEAVDSTGNILSVDVKNEETGRVETVRKWGERVSLDCYEGIKRDNKDNGLIDGSGFGGRRKDADLIGMKEIGYLESRFDDLYEVQGGQITKWRKVNR